MVLVAPKGVDDGAWWQNSVYMCICVSTICVFEKEKGMAAWWQNSWNKPMCWHFGQLCPKQKCKMQKANARNTNPQFLKIFWKIQFLEIPQAHVLAVRPTVPKARKQNLVFKRYLWAQTTNGDQTVDVLQHSLHDFGYFTVQISKYWRNKPNLLMANAESLRNMNNEVQHVTDTCCLTVHSVIWIALWSLWFIIWIVELSWMPHGSETWIMELDSAQESCCGVLNALHTFHTLLHLLIQKRKKQIQKYKNTKIHKYKIAQIQHKDQTLQRVRAAVSSMLCTHSKHRIPLESSG